MKRTLVFVFLLICVCCLFFWPIFKGYIPFPGDLVVNTNPYRSLSILGYPPDGFPNKAQGRDVITEMFPWRYFAISELKHTRIPFWNPYNFSGNILMQNLQSSVFNPFNLVFFILPFVRAWTVFILIQPILASIFFYFFAREIGLGKFASFLGGIGFAFSSYMTVWIEYGNIAATIAYLPLLLFFLLRFLKNHKVINYVGFTITGVLMLLSGYIQGAFYSFFIALCFAVYFLSAQRKNIRMQQILPLVGMFAFPIFLTLFQYLPTLDIFSQSTRWPYSVAQFENMLQPIWYWITIFASDFFGNPATRNYYLSRTYIESVAYVGIPFLFFAYYAISKKKAFSHFFLFFSCFVFLVTTNLPGIAFLYKLPIPVINTTVPTRFLSIFMFCMVVLGAMGIDTFFKELKIPKKQVIIFSIIYCFLWLGTYFGEKIYPQFIQQISIAQHNLVVPTLLIAATFFVLFIARKYKKSATVLLGIIVVVDLLYVFQKITPFSPIQTVYPDTPVISFIKKNAGINRFWSYGSGYVQPNYETVDGTYSPEGNDPLHIKNYGELLASSYNGKIPNLPPRPDANLAQGYGPTGMQNPYRQTLLNLLGIKYVLQHDESRQNGDDDTQTFPKETYQLVWSQNPWQIYENKNVFPRYFLANTYVVAKGQKALDLMYKIDLKKTVVLDSKPAQTVNTHATGSVHLNSYETQKVSFTTQTNGPMLLFLSDTYYSAWKAEIDTKQAPIYLADYAFRSIVIPSGKHTVTMYYESKSFSLGILIAGVALVVFLASLFIVKKYESKK